MVIGTALLLLATYLIGNRQNMFGKTFDITADFKNVNGLQVGNNVRFSGIHVGTVSDIEIIDDTTIRVHMVIDDKMQEHIKKNAVAAIGSDGLVGSMLVNIVPGNGPSTTVRPGDALQSYSKVAAQDMMSTLSTTNENAAMLTADLLKITRSLNQGKGTLGRLLNDTTLANDFQETIGNLKLASTRINATMGELNQMVGQINFKESAGGVLLGDTLSGGKIKNIIENLETSSIAIEKITQNLNEVIDGIREGDGAINYLAKDTVLVNQLNKTMSNIEQGAERFNENMEALKHNFLTRGYFRKLEKQNKKENPKGDVD